MFDGAHKQLFRVGKLASKANGCAALSYTPLGLRVGLRSERRWRGEAIPGLARGWPRVGRGQRETRRRRDGATRMVEPPHRPGQSASCRLPWIRDRVEASASDTREAVRTGIARTGSNPDRCRRSAIRPRAPRRGCLRSARSWRRIADGRQAMHTVAYESSTCQTCAVGDSMDSGVGPANHNQRHRYRSQASTAMATRSTGRPPAAPIMRTAPRVSLPTGGDVPVSEVGTSGRSGAAHDHER
jgi:hypothetical protein